MININTNNITNYKPREFAKLLNVSVKTLQGWDRDKILIAKRTPTDKRYYTYDQYLEYKGFDSENKNSRKIILYTRVSTNNQKDDLKNQILLLQNFINAKGIIIDKVVEAIGSGLNYNRKKWNKLINECVENKIDTIYITHKDRFIRFGYEWFEKLLGKFSVKIIVVNNQLLSPQEELVQDIVSILHVFSCRIYGMRKYKKKIEEDEELAKSVQNGNKPNTRTED